MKRRYIKEIEGYELSNPYFSVEPLKHRIMKVAHVAYRKMRVRMSRLFPLKEWQQVYWDEERNNSLFTEQNAPVDPSNEPYFRMEFLHIHDYFPKEHINTIKNGLRKFCHAHGNDSMFNSYHDDVCFFDEFRGGFAYANLVAVGIKESSPLYGYISQLNIHLINLSNSFCGVIYTVMLNNDLKSKIEKLVLSNIDCNRKLVVKNDIKWRHFTRLNYGEYSGTLYKAELFNDVIIDIKWRVASEIHKYIPTVIFQSQRVVLPSVYSACTNIDGNSNQDFWRSIDVDSRFCDYCNDFSSCISWYNTKNNMAFIYSPSLHGETLAYDISQYLASYMIASSVDENLRKQLVNFSKDISNLPKKNLKHWLKLKLKIDKDTFFSIRFINEYESIDDDFAKFVKLPKFSTPYIKTSYTNIIDHLADTKKLYTSIMSLFESNTNYKNVQQNYKIQRITLFATALSSIIAVFALIVSMASNNAIMDKIMELFNWLLNMIQ